MVEVLECWETQIIRPWQFEALVGLRMVELFAADESATLRRA